MDHDKAFAHNTFVDAWLAGDCVADDIDEWVEAWHDEEQTRSRAYLAVASPMIPLCDYLGFTAAEYTTWAHNPSTLCAILTAIKARPYTVVVKQDVTDTGTYNAIVADIQKRHAELDEQLKQLREKRDRDNERDYWRRLRDTR